MFFLNISMKYSIITVNLNNKVGLRRTIESVVAQKCQDFEYIIIDGGSTDGSVEVIKEYTGKIDYWVSEKDKGIYNAMNKGILVAHGEYLNFMNSGDTFHTLTILGDLLQYLTVDILLGKAYTIQSGRLIAPHSNLTLYNLCIYGFNHQATFYKADLFNNKKYDETLCLLSDWKFTMENIIFNQCSYCCIDQVVVDYDLSGLSSLNRDIAKEEQRKILFSLLPPGIYKDYLFFSQIRTPLLNDLPFLADKYRLHIFIVSVFRLIVRFYKLFFGKNK